MGLTFFQLFLDGREGQMEGSTSGISTAWASTTARRRFSDDGAATVLDDDGVGRGGGSGGARIAADGCGSQLGEPLEALLGRMQRERREDALAADSDVGVHDVGQRREGGRQRHLAAFDQIHVAAQLAVLQVVEIDGGSPHIQLDAKRLQIGI